MKISKSFCIPLIFSTLFSASTYAASYRDECAKRFQGGSIGWCQQGYDKLKGENLMRRVIDIKKKFCSKAINIRAEVNTARSSCQSTKGYACENYGKWLMAYNFVNEQSIPVYPQLCDRLPTDSISHCVNGYAITSIAAAENLICTGNPAHKLTTTGALYNAMEATSNRCLGKGGQECAYTGEYFRVFDAMLDPKNKR